MSKSLQALERLVKASNALLNAEWMVTHDWGGDREAVLRDVRSALRGLCTIAKRRHAAAKRKGRKP